MLKAAATRAGEALEMERLGYGVSEIFPIPVLPKKIPTSPSFLTSSTLSLNFPPKALVYPLAIGATSTTVNPAYTATEISKQANDSDPKLVVTVTEQWDKLQHFNLPVVFLCSSSAITTSFDALVELARWPTEFRADVLVGDHGSGKGVVMTHRNFVAASLMLVVDDDLAGEMSSAFLCVLPMFHMFGKMVILYAQLRRGSVVVSLKRFKFEPVPKTVDKFRVKHLWVVPPIILALAKHGLVNKYDLSSLKYIDSDVALLRKELMEECGKRFPSCHCFLGMWLGVRHSGSARCGSARMLVARAEAQI
ncbi:4-coumarate--CoA ligase-like 7, partial [Mucuna pruriens]